MTDDITGKLRELIEAERQRFGAPGCAVAVVHDGEVVLAEGFGKRDIANDLPVTTATLFPIGSSTKTFTAALCATLVRDGVLAWDKPVRDYLPEFRMHDPAATDGLTFRDMLSHRSGLPRHDLLWYAAKPSITRDELITTLRHLEPSRGLREIFQYNNLLYTTAGHLAGKLHGSSYEEAVRDRVLTPLGMKRTNFSVSDAQQDADCSRPYFVGADGGEPREVPFASLDLVGPAGNINSCVEELLPWVQTLLGRGVDGQEPLLGESILRDMRSPVSPLPEGSPLAVGKPVGYCLGLMTEDYRGFRVSHHGGNIDGFSSQVSHIPATGSAVIVLTNRNGTMLRDALPYVIYDVLLGLTPEPHGERLWQKEDALRQGMEQAKQHRAASSRDLGIPRPIAEYVATYHHPGYGDLRVTESDGALRGHYGEVSGPLEHRHLETFDLVVQVPDETRLPMQFTSDFDGDVNGLLAPLEPTVSPIRFTRVPDTSHLTDDVLDRLAGDYQMGPVTATVKRRGDTDLLIAIAYMPPTKAEPVHGLVFKLGGQRIEFIDDGKLQTPLGQFTRA